MFFWKSSKLVFSEIKVMNAYLKKAIDSFSFCFVLILSSEQKFNSVIFCIDIFEFVFLDINFKQYMFMLQNISIDRV